MQPRADFCRWRLVGIRHACDASSARVSRRTGGKATCSRIAYIHDMQPAVGLLAGVNGLATDQTPPPCSVHSQYLELPADGDVWWLDIIATNECCSRAQLEPLSIPQIPQSNGPTCHRRPLRRCYCLLVSGLLLQSEAAIGSWCIPTRARTQTARASQAPSSFIVNLEPSATPPAVLSPSPSLSLSLSLSLTLTLTLTRSPISARQIARESSRRLSCFLFSVRSRVHGPSRSQRSLGLACLPVCSI
ncbi:hypothetical protein J3F83DRAFT_43088 [Trichoderma novae-zelandiae]